MTERPEGGVWIGFRNPIPGGKALLFTLGNPERVVNGERPAIGDPVLLDLGGLGVRSLSYWHGRYLIVAGHFDSGTRSWLYTWDGRGAPARLSQFDFSRFNPEGFFTPDERGEVLVLSDDGGVAIGDKDCKKLKNPDRKQFRGAWLKIAPRRDPTRPRSWNYESRQRPKPHASGADHDREQLPRDRRRSIE